MRKKNLWITLSLVNLCIVALFGMTLRTKFVLPISFIDYKNFLSAHSHFAFGGWVTLALMVLFIDNFLTEQQKQKKIYQWILWGIELNALGMVISFPFHGYAFFSIVTSTLFIFFTYAFSWVFVKDILKAGKEKLVRLLSIGAVVSLVISSAGPFTLAYMMSSGIGNAFLYKDAVYTFMHFQYNGFFTLGVFSLFFNQVSGFLDEGARKRFWLFAVFICLSVIPAMFLSLLWHSSNIYVRTLAIIGASLILVAVAFFISFAFNKQLYRSISSQAARTLLALAMVSFGIKMILQIGTIFPNLGNAVFGYRPIIIGFLHLVFLGLVTFYILSNFIQNKIFDWEKPITKLAIRFFAASIIINETILLVDGIGLMFYTTTRIFPWLLWGASILLFTGSLLILTARLKSTSDGHPAIR